MRGIDAAGAYLPRHRLPRDAIEEAWGTASAPGVDRKAVPAADEDALTMAATAAERALDRDVGFVGVATTTPPLEEGALAPRLARMLGLPRGVATATATASTAAVAGVIERARAAGGPALVVAADCPEGDPADADHPLGAGAAALVIDDDAAVGIRDVAWYGDDYPGVRYRERGERRVTSLGSTTYERDAVRECVAGAIGGLDVSVGDAAVAALHQPDGRLPGRLGRDLPVDAEAIERGTVADGVGDAGAATAALGLLSGLADADAGDRAVIAPFGGGGEAAAVALEVAAPIESGIGAALDGGEGIGYAAYLRERGYVVDGEVAGGGAHVSVPTWRRTLDSRYRLAAGRCPDCGAVAFPPEGACPDCGARADFERETLPRRGEVVAATTIEQGGAPPEFLEQQRRDGAYAVAIVELGDARVPGMVVDADPDAVGIGDVVRAVVRRVYEREGVARYGVKFVPADR